MSSELPHQAPSPTSASPDRSADAFDVVVVGGGFAGASFGLLLKRQQPAARVAIVELSEQHGHRVGEATVEVSGCFLARVLGLYQHLSAEHQPKHGLRYWLTDDPQRTLATMTEVGSTELPHLPSFQLDRQILDEHVLTQAADAGCHLVRPAKVKSVEEAWPASTVTLETPEKTRRQLTTRWVVDASGRRALLARRWRLLDKETRHPTAAAWGWWRGVADIDAVVDAFTPDDSPRLAMSRRLATNHFCGYGWWIWMIPQRDGETSIGVVYNKDLFQLPGEGTVHQRYEAFVRSRPGLGELVAEATLEGGDLGASTHLPYRSRQYMDRGWALVGDAASFLDPYYSPGLDHAAISIVATVDLVVGDLSGSLDDKSLGDEITRHNGEFARSYDRWLEALYLDKYEILGDAELIASAFLIDTALYHLGVVTPVYRQPEALSKPIFGLDLPQAKVAYRLMAAFNRRLVGLARHRRRVGTYGRRNAGERIAGKAFGLGVRGVLAPLSLGLRLWLRLEAQRLLHPLLRGLGRVPAAPKPQSSPSPRPGQV